MDVREELYEARQETWKDDRDDIALSFIDGALERADDYILDLESELTDAKERADKAEQTVRELLDRLADVHAGIRDLDETLTGAMVRETILDNTQRASGIAHCELWRSARELAEVN